MRDRYWHNMAARIQRAFRNYLRYKQECASRIQRFWKSKKDGLAFLQLRDYSHQVLNGRKERRRFSLVSMRQFNGDYLDVGGKSPQGEMLRSACGIASSENVAFSMNGQILVSKLGRSSKLSPRYLILVSHSINDTSRLNSRADLSGPLHCHHSDCQQPTCYDIRAEDPGHEHTQRWLVFSKGRLVRRQRGRARRRSNSLVCLQD
jgi:myosin heavy subunit